MVFDEETKGKSLETFDNKTGEMMDKSVFTTYQVTMLMTLRNLEWICHREESTVRKNHKHNHAEAGLVSAALSLNAA